MSVTIWTTTGCNMKCKYCYEMQSKQRNSKVIRLTDEKIDALIEWIKNSSLANDSIMFHGGEPLLNFDAIQSIVTKLETANRLPQRMGLTTNGMVWNNKIEDFFKEYKTLFEKNMSLSIDGIELVHNMNRRTKLDEDSYRKVVETKERMLVLFPELRARMTVTSDSVGKLYDGVISLVNMGFKTVTAALDEYDENWNESHISILKEEIKKIVEYWSENKELRLPYINGLLYRNTRGVCKFSYNIYPNGDIYPCMAVTGIKKFCIGNVQSGLNMDKIKELNEEIRGEYEICSTCNNIKYCIHNRCRLVNYTMNKNYNIPNILGCRMESVQFQIRKEMSSLLNNN